MYKLNNSHSRRPLSSLYNTQQVDYANNKFRETNDDLDIVRRKETFYLSRPQGRYLRHKSEQFNKFFNHHPLVDLNDYPRVRALAMGRNIDQLIDEFRHRLFKALGGRSISILYGSYATQNQRSNSDIDLMFSCDQDTYKKYRKYLLPIIQIFLEDLHELVAAKIEDEVPSQSKHLVNIPTMLRGARADVFYPDGQDQSPVVEPISKFLVNDTAKGSGQRFPEKFLASEYLRLRLIFNVLTSPNKMSGYAPYLQGLDCISSNSLRKLHRALCEQMPGKEGIQCLLENDQGDKGEMWLGYKQNRKGVVEKLESIVSPQIKSKL